MGDISNEPSMEDILSSIKKIIAEDGDRKLAPSLSRRAPVTEAMPEPVADPVPSLAPSFAEDEEEDVFELKAEAIESEPRSAAPKDAEIVSEGAAAASRSALSSLSRMIVKPEVQGSDTLEGVVRDMLRPMLKDWLDHNLPRLVEEMVAKEIARISGKTLI